MNFPSSHKDSFCLKPFISCENWPFQGKGKAIFQGKLSLRGNFPSEGKFTQFSLQGKILPQKDVMGMPRFQVDFQEVKRPLGTKSGKRPIKVRKRPIKEGKRPIKAMVLVGISVGCLMGCFRVPPPWRKTAPLKRPINRKFGDGGVRKGGVAQICRKFLRKILRKIVSLSCISMSRHQQPMLSQWNDSNFPHLKVSSRWMSTTHSETHCDRHHELQTALREVAEILRKFCGICGHFSEIWFYCASEGCGNFAEIFKLKCAENFRREVGVQIPLRDACGSANFRNSEKGAFTKGALRKFLRKFCASFASSSFREEGCAKLCANLYANWKSISDKFMQIPLFQCPHLRISELRGL